MPSDSRDQSLSDTKDIVVKRDEGVTITFSDDMVAQFDLMQLRLGCPCAECRSMRERGQDVWPRPHSPLPLRIDDAKFHGAWGLAITWNDGHSTGIFPFESLRRWAEGGILFGPAADPQTAPSAPPSPTPEPEPDDAGFS